MSPVLPFPVWIPQLSSWLLHTTSSRLAPTCSKDTNPIATQTQYPSGSRTALRINPESLALVSCTASCLSLGCLGHVPYHISSDLAYRCPLRLILSSQTFPYLYNYS